MIAMISSSFFRMSAATPDWLRDGGGAEDWLRSGGSAVCVTIMASRREAITWLVRRRPGAKVCAASVAQSRDCAVLLRPWPRPAVFAKSKWLIERPAAA